MKLNFFRKRESKDKKVSKDDLVKAITNQINELYEYSTDTLEKIINLENKLKDLEELKIKLHNQSSAAHQKSNTRLYKKSIIKLSQNTNEQEIISNNILKLKEKLKIALEDIKSLETILTEL